MRGYNLSEKPTDLSSYKIPTLVADVVALIEFFGRQQAVVVGHDWGGMVTWACARLAPERLTRLVIINAPHPVIFGRELANNPDQQSASEYIQRLRAPEAEASLSDNHYWLSVNPAMNYPSIGQSTWLA